MSTTAGNSTTGGTIGGVGIGNWAKALNGTVIATLATVVTALQNGQIERAEWFAIGGTLLATFLAVGFVKNAQRGVMRYVKTILGGVLAFIGALATGGAVGDISQSQWIVAIMALLTALPVWWSSNASDSDVFRAARTQQVTSGGTV